MAVLSRGPDIRHPLQRRYFPEVQTYVILSCGCFTSVPCPPSALLNPWLSPDPSMHFKQNVTIKRICAGTLVVWALHSDDSAPVLTEHADCRYVEELFSVGTDPRIFVSPKAPLFSYHIPTTIIIFFSYGN